MGNISLLVSSTAQCNASGIGMPLRSASFRLLSSLCRYAMLYRSVVLIVIRSSPVSIATVYLYLRHPHSFFYMKSERAFTSNIINVCPSVESRRFAMYLKEYLIFAAIAVCALVGTYNLNLMHNGWEETVCLIVDQIVQSDCALRDHGTCESESGECDTRYHISTVVELLIDDVLTNQVRSDTRRDLAAVNAYASSMHVGRELPCWYRRTDPVSIRLSYPSNAMVLALIALVINATAMCVIFNVLYALMRHFSTRREKQD